VPEVQPFGVRFQEAIDHLKGKLPEASLAWDSLAGPVHAKVFTVAGSTSASLSADIQKALVSALENGTTITQFRKDFDQVVAQHGWTYNGKRGWRTQVIFGNNMRSATMAGRWAQLQANKKRRPFLQYRTAGDARVRPQHRAWNGVIRAIDDAFWSTHYPPNGWGCRCTVRAYSQFEIDDENLHVETVPYKTHYRDVITADGVVDRVPVGIDPGWDHNVGISWISPELALGAKLATLPSALRGPLVDKTISPAFQKAIEANWKAFQRTVKATGKPKSVPQILGFLDSSTLNGLATQVPELTLQSSAIAALDNRTNHLAGIHKVGANPLQVWPQDLIDDIPSLLRSYRAVLWDQISQELVFVPDQDMPEAEDRLPKIVARPNVKTKYGMAWSIVSLGSAKQADLRDPKRYRVLVGKL